VAKLAPILNNCDKGVNNKIWYFVLLFLSWIISYSLEIVDVKIALLIYIKML